MGSTIVDTVTHHRFTSLHLNAQYNNNELHLQNFQRPQTFKIETHVYMTRKKMFESRPEDALVKLVKLYRL